MEEPTSHSSDCTYCPKPQGLNVTFALLFCGAEIMCEGC